LAHSNFFWAERLSRHQNGFLCTMRLHKEGRLLIPLCILVIAGIWSGLYFPLLNGTAVWWIGVILALAGLIFIGLVFNFFRNPPIDATVQDNAIVCPCDGKVVVIEEVFDPIYFKAQVRQISIFMSPLNVHVNRNPIGGKVKFAKYSPGKYLVAWHPKSSTENEQTFFAIENSRWTIGFKQIAGAVARRICWYVKEGDSVQQSAEMGFIKFGSRMDLLLPLDAEIKVKLEEVVFGGVTVIAVDGK
jgi:phosphatidylserine decarboxylase